MFFLLWIFVPIIAIVVYRIIKKITKSQKEKKVLMLEVNDLNPIINNKSVTHTILNTTKSQTSATIFDVINSDTINRKQQEFIAKIKATFKQYPQYENYSPEQEDLCDEKYIPDFHLYSDKYRLTNEPMHKKCYINEKTMFKEFTDCNHFLYDLELIITKLYRKENISSSVLEKLLDIVKKLDSKYKLIQLVKYLENFWDHDVYIDEVSLKKISTPKTFQSICKFIKKPAFNKTYEKNFQQLISELIKSNKNINNDSVVQKYYEIETALKSQSNILRNGTNIAKWEIVDITKWSDKLSHSNDLQVEKLAVIRQAIEVVIGKKFRDIQMLSVIIMITDLELPKGRLAQIDTGEGKTLIIAVIAAYFILMGRNVDIVTSSSILAKNQLNELKNFYDKLGITASHICEKGNTDYRSDILYGTNTEFQGDLLQDEFRRSGVRCNRKFDVVIVDEADNMLIDNKSDSVLLTNDLPTMKYTEKILGEIWKRIIESYRAHNGEYTAELKNNILHTTEQTIRELITNHTSSGFKIPYHLKELLDKVYLKVWIESAFAVKFDYVEETNYIIKNNKIIVIDAHNTGVMRNNTVLSNGIQQFLQFEHGLELEQESVVTNFISTSSFFFRYNYIFGLTGTLGSHSTQKLLKKTYNIDSIIIPSFKKKIHKHLLPIIGKNRTAWQFQIVKSCLRRLKNGQVVLIIMEFIKEVEPIKKIFIKTFGYESSKISLFKTNDDENIINNTFTPGSVIITTNIAGRGIDFKLSVQVNKNGGLHVCLTFKPQNSRIEGQKNGRTSRSGCPGSSQLVLCLKCNYAQLEEACIKLEDKEMERAEEQIQKAINKDKIFEKFSVILENIRGRNEFVRAIEKEAVEERFGIWLKMNDDDIDTMTNDEIFNNFKQFTNEILKDDLLGKIIKNSYFFTKIGKEYFKHAEYSVAIDEFSSAIVLDKDFAEDAYCYRALTYIVLYLQKRETNYINKAIDDFECFVNLSKSRLNDLMILRSISNGDIFSQHFNKLIYSQCLIIKSVNENKKLLNIRKTTLGDVGNERRKLLQQIENVFNNDLYDNNCLKREIACKYSETDGSIYKYLITLFLQKIMSYWDSLWNRKNTNR